MLHLRGFWLVRWEWAFWSAVCVCFDFHRKWPILSVASVRMVVRILRKESPEQASIGRFCNPYPSFEAPVESPMGTKELARTTL